MHHTSNYLSTTNFNCYVKMLNVIIWEGFAPYKFLFSHKRGFIYSYPPRSSLRNREKKCHNGGPWAT